MTSFRLRGRPDRAVSLQIHTNERWCTVVIFYQNGRIIRASGLPRGCGLNLDGAGRIIRG